MIVKWLGRLCGVMTLLALIAAWGFGSIMTSRHSVPNSPLPAGAQLVHIKTKDGITLAGNFWPGRSDHAPAILMLHGIGSSRQQFDDNGVAFAAKGYAALAINTRAHGDSTGDQRTIGYLEGIDAHAALDWLKVHQHGAKVGVMGDSLGGAAALLGPLGPLDADAFVLTVMYPDIRHAVRSRLSESLGNLGGMIAEPFLSYQSVLRFGVWPEDMSPMNAIRKVHTPAFIIGGEKDSYTPPIETRMIFNAANQPKQLWIVPGGTHNGTTEHPDYDSKVDTFLDKALH